MTDSPDNRPPPPADALAGPDPLDAHVHVWDLARRQLPWLLAGHPLRRDFSLPDLTEASDGRLPDTILVQADADPLEVTDLLDLAATTSSVLGVVGWFDLHSDLQLPADSNLVGIRCPPADQTDPDALTDPAFVRGVRAAADAGLAIDLLLRPPALIGAARLATAVPDARLVLDHLGNPSGPTADWSTGMKALAEAPNVTVKLSGTAHLPSGDLAELIAVTLDLFGSDRVMFGSDWPVCTLSSSRAEAIRRTTELLPAAAHNDVFRGTAERTYRP
ncbi:L-fuconolactonase [Kribbella sp. VKM Ac-2527]|uniref:L-fuconolactonase n=1 Tax=Kribbella caucasensis TaxID=2512215 RepID=A0A4R6KMK0_9ACTN|nr:amidohydrolase family protein [Kribbella sp. VKM Ac-2527]TDO52481.1 L-fuconolactonase [Kribbella sp. VKM Ac-2527]